MQLWLFLAAVNGFLAVSFGAFGAHGLQGKVAPEALAAFETGATYHLAHALALGLVAFARSQNLAGADWAGGALLAGIVLFSGSLYFLGITESRALVLVTPLGGLAFLIGWALLAWGAVRGPSG